MQQTTIDSNASGEVISKNFVEGFERNGNGSFVETVIAHANPIIKVGENSFRYESVRIITKKTVSSEMSGVERFSERFGRRKQLAGDEFFQFMKFFETSMKTWTFGDSILFSTSLDKMYKFVDGLESLFVRFDSDKAKQLDSTNGDTVPEFSFREIHKNLRTFVERLEEFLVSSFRFRLKEYLFDDENGVGQNYFVGFDPEETIPVDKARSRALSSEFFFFLEPEATFLSGDLFPGRGDFEEASPIPFANWIDISHIRVDQSLVDEQFLFSENLDAVYIHRNMLLGNYRLVRESLLNETTRNIFVFLKEIQESFIEKYSKSSTWEDFCSGYIRPVVILQEGPVAKELNKDVYSLEEKLKEDERVYSAKEKSKVVSANRGKYDDVDSGILSDLKKDLKSAKTLDGLYRVLERIRLKDLVESSAECVGFSLPGGDVQSFARSLETGRVSIPEISAPKFSSPVLPIFGGASQEIVPMAVEQIESAITAAVKEYVDKFFTVDSCEDWKQFFDKDFYNRAFKEFLSLLNDLKDDLLQLIAGDQYLGDAVSCYGADGLLDFVSMLFNEIRREDAIDFFGGLISFEPWKLIEVALGTFDARTIERCGVPSSSVVQRTLAVIGAFIPRDKLDEILERPPVQLGENSACAISWDNFMAWMESRGIGREEALCAKESWEDGRRVFDDTLQSYLNGGGVFSGAEPFFVGEFFRERAKQFALTCANNVFPFVEKLLGQYSSLSCSPDFDGTSASLEDAAFLGSLGPDGLDVAATMKVGGFLRPSNMAEEESFFEGNLSLSIPFFDVYEKLSIDGDIQNPFFLEYIDAHFSSRCMFDKRHTQMEIMSDVCSASLTTDFAGHSKHNRTVVACGSEVDILSGETGTVRTHPEWYRPIVDKVVSSAAVWFSGEDFDSRGWEGAVFTNVIAQLQSTFFNHLVGRIFENDFRRQVPVSDDSADVISYTDMLSIVLSKQLSGAQPESVDCKIFNVGNFCDMVVERSVFEANKRRRDDQDLVRSISENEFASRFSAFEFFISCPFLWHMNKDYDWQGGIVSSFLSEYFSDAEKILTNNVEFIDRGGGFAYFGGDITNDVLDDMERDFNLMLNWEDKVSSEFARGLRLMSSSFAEFVGGGVPCFGGWVKSLPVWQIAGKNEISGISNMNFSRRSILTLGVEYFADGTWKTVRFDNSSLFASEIISFADLGGGIVEFSEISESGGKFRISLNLVLTSEEISKGLNLSVGDKVLCVAPLVKEEVTFNGPFGSTAGFLEIIQGEMVNSDQLKKMFHHNLMFGDVFELLQLFLFDLARKTTRIGEFSGILSSIGVRTDDFTTTGATSFTSQAADDTFGTLRSQISVTSIQKMALEMLLKTPYLIFKSQVEMFDPVIRMARKIVDSAKIRGENKSLTRTALIDLRPANLWLLAAKSPPITQSGILYLVLEEKFDRRREVKSSIESSDIGEMLASGPAPGGFGVFCLIDDVRMDVMPEIREPKCADSYPRG